MIAAVWRLDEPVDPPVVAPRPMAGKWRATLLAAADGYEPHGARLVSLDAGLGAPGEAWALVNIVAEGAVHGGISWRPATPAEAAIARSGRCP